MTDQPGHPAGLGELPPAPPRGPSEALTHEVAEVVRTLFSAGTVAATLARVVGLAVSTIEGCDLAGVFVVQDGAATSLAHTGPLALELALAQRDGAGGPGVQAAADHLTCYVPDLAVETRWSRFGAAATGSGVRSVLALPIAADATQGALVLYGRFPHAFGVIDRARGLLLASISGLACSSAQTHEAAQRKAVNLAAALDTREVIGQAQGILMERERVSADEAFEILRRASQHLNRKVREIAQSLVDTGERPDTGTPPRGDHP